MKAYEGSARAGPLKEEKGKSGGHYDEVEQEERVPHGGVLPSQAVEISAARRPEKIALGTDAEG